MADGVEQGAYEGLSLEQYKRWWREASTDYATARQESLTDRDYRDGIQWTEEELETLRKRKQPASVFNVISRKVDGIVGVELRTRTEPRAYPRTPQDQEASEVATDTLRYIKEKTRWSSLKTVAFEFSLVEGFAAVEIGGAPDDVPVTPISPDEFFFDPRSRKPDFSDARYLGTAKWVDADVAAATFGQNEEIVQSTLDTALSNEEFKDRPSDQWGDQTRKRVFVVDMWHMDPKSGWHRCVFTGAGKLFNEPASMIGEKGLPTHPILAFSIYVSRQNWRYGVVRGMRPVQDEVNKRRSSLLHRAVQRQLKVKRGSEAFANKEATRAEAARPDGILEFTADPKEIEYLNNGEQIAVHSELLDNAIAFMERLGPNPQLMGEAGAASSGRAILALQQAGLGELGVVFERLRDWELRCYRTMWMRVRQFWTGPMYVRVTDDANKVKFAPVNGAQMPMMDDNGQPQMQQDPMTGQPVPQMQQGPMLADLDMDIIIDAAPEAATLQAEQFETLAKMAANGIAIPPEVLIEASSLPNKTALMDKMKQAAAAPPNPMQQLEMADKQAGVQLKQAQAMAAGAKPQIDAARLELDAIEAGVDTAQTAQQADSNDQIAREKLANDRQKANGKPPAH